MKWIVMGAACLSLLNMSTAHGEDNIKNSDALLYVVLGGCPDVTTRCDITVDGVVVGSLGPKEFLKVRVSAGTHTIDAIWPGWSAGFADEFRYNFSKGQIVYITPVNGTKKKSPLNFLMRYIRGKPIYFIETRAYRNETELVGYGYHASSR